jgi:hypothetical protein
MPDTSIFPALSDFHPLPASLAPAASNGIDDQPPVTMASPDVEDFFENGAIALHLVGPDGVILKANRAEHSWAIAQMNILGGTSRSSI